MASPGRSGFGYRRLVASFFSYDGTRLHYDVIGARMGADPIVVHAGGPARHPAYLGDLAGVHEVRPLLILHQRGVGESQQPVDPHTGWWPSLADDLESLRNHLGLTQLDLLGHSAGTRVALSYAARYPRQVSRLCLVTPPATWLVEVESDIASLVARYCSEPWFAGVQAAFDAMSTAQSPEERIRLTRTIAPITYYSWNDRTRAHADVGQWYPKALAAFFSRPAGSEPVTELIPAALSVVTAPVLIIAGADDTMTGLRPVVALAEVFADGRAVVLPECGHYPWVEQPERFLAEVGAFFCLG